MKRSYSTNQIRTDTDDRTAVFVISDGSRDRHGTVLNMENWMLENYNRNGIVGFQHDVYGGEGSDPDNIIGKGRAWIENGQRATGNGPVLMGEVQFEPEDINPLAEKVFRKVQHGTLNATSVGFNPLQNDSGETGNWRTGTNGKRTYYYYGQELLEFSIVSIPSNPNALKRHLNDDRFKPPAETINIGLEKRRLELEKLKLL